MVVMVINPFRVKSHKTWRGNFQVLVRGRFVFLFLSNNSFIVDLPSRCHAMKTFRVCLSDFQIRNSCRGRIAISSSSSDERSKASSHSADEATAIFLLSMMVGLILAPKMTSRPNEYDIKVPIRSGHAARHFFCVCVVISAFMYCREQPGGLSIGRRRQ